LDRGTIVPSFPLLLMMAGVLAMVGMFVFAFAGPSAAKASNRRLESVRERHSRSNEVATQAQLKRILQTRQQSKMEDLAERFIPNPALLTRRLQQTGKSITLPKYALICLGLALVVGAILAMKGVPPLLSLFIALFVGIGLPHKVVSRMITRRVAKFTARFPDAIDLMVRGLRAGLPISETLGTVGDEIPGPISEEFRSVSDKMKIGRTMDAALQDTADRLGTPEVQFFVITLAIQRETGGNLAETLGNLSEVLRKRAQMKLKIRAMSSESKASAWIVGALPFIVFFLIWFINNDYMSKFFTDERLMIAGGGGLCWMGIGVFIMSKMVNFEI
jgi:tight adherence protein B